MASLFESLKRIAKSAFRPAHLPAIIALVVIILLGAFADRQNATLSDQRRRAEVLNHVSMIRAKLEGHVTGNIQLVRGLIAAIATEPDMKQERFADLAESLFRERSQLRNIAGAPNLVISLMYPMQGNEKAIGLDYRNNAAQRDGALRARDRGELFLAGPVDLVQGGQGIIGRFPVFIGKNGTNRTFWGIVSAVIDVQKLYADSGLLDESRNFDIAITGKDAMGSKGVRFYGDQAVIDGDPVTADVVLPSGSWQIAATPRGGWSAAPDDAWLLRLLICLGGLLVVVPTWITGRLFEERQRYIAKVRDREVELERVSQRLEIALDASKVGVWEFDFVADKLVWDDRMNELYGLPRDSGARKYSHWQQSLHPDDAPRAEAEFHDAIATGGRYHSEFRLLLPDGAVRVIRAIGAVYESAGTSHKIIGVNWDVSEDVRLTEDLKRSKSLTEARNRDLETARANIEYNALHDALTSLPNRRYLDKTLEEQAARCAEIGGSVGLLHVDLDRFKQINDTLGHAAGDAMLVHAAKVIQANLREGDFVARTGGDEFVVVCTSDVGTPALGSLARRLIEQMQRPTLFEGHECRFGVSVGIASASGEAVDHQRLLVNADIALYRAKNRGRNRFEFFTEALQAEIISTKLLADNILSGLEQRQFIPYFQPQFDARTFDLVGVEALARWRHPERGILAPDAFLGIAEELNVVATIDRMVLEQSLDHFNRWARLGIEVPRLSVNVSSRRLHDDALIESLRGLNIAPGTLSFELVESIYLDESDDIVEWNIEQIKDFGIDIEIDDFGTGYASIVSLTKLKPRRLKIDRQLITPIVASPAQRHLVESIVDIGKSLGIEVAAEGVETMEHALLLRDLGCDILQGYAFARPMDVDQFESLVAAQTWRAAS